MSRLLELVNGLASTCYSRGALKVHRAEVPVISVGNLAVGGTGKTPLVAALAATLVAAGAKPVVLTRGYRRRDRAPRLVVGAAAPGWEEIGDEPAMLARSLPSVPIVVDADRVRGARTAVAQGGATHLILDDGFQHWRLARDLDVVTLDARDPLCRMRFRRERPVALGRADIAVVADDGTVDRGALAALLATVAPRLHVLFARLIATGVDASRGREAPEWLQGRRVLAFAGIADPGRFARTLASLGAEVVELARFPDHHAYSRSEVTTLAGRAGALGATPMTTAKDAVKLAPGDLERVAVLRIELAVEGLDEVIAPLVAAGPAAKRLESRP